MAALTDREQLVAATVQEIGRTSRELVELALAIDAAATRWDLADLLDSAQRLADLGVEFAGLYRRLLATWVREPPSVHVGHEMSST
jgi:hypothetical protein